MIPCYTARDIRKRKRRKKIVCMKKVGKVLLIIALILVLLLALAYGALQGLLGHGPFRFLNTMYLKGLPGNAEIYRPENVAP